ncbi:hypothetical protein DFH07DRAFT_866732 [Mycena maculata]|uniref:C2H2-type domain-containing protein n=1 Tax=Mycena maculata TaxID=230809 RepID=A0AAD7JQ87_9AGAR|nr:hypothetical protein DFH07DRAFT_866732 [Mycena maculata]
MPHGKSYTCTICVHTHKSCRGLTQHQNSAHCHFTPASEDEDDNTFQTQYHPQLNALPCTADGVFLAPYIGPPAPPAPPPDGQAPAAWAPFGDRAEFDFAHFHFVQTQSSENDINIVLDIWAASVLKYGATALWNNARMAKHPGKTHTLRYSGPLPPGQPPKWMTQSYKLCTRDTRQLMHNQLGTIVFKDHVNFVPYRQFNHSGKRVWSNLMSGDWAWKQADVIGQDPQIHGSAFVPIVATRLQFPVATGHQEYHPVYVSPAHGNRVLPAAFLPIPKTSKKHHKKPEYQKFVQQMYHACLAKIFQPLKDAMMTPEVAQCPDHHFRRVIYGLGSYIADYPEQVWLTAIPNNLNREEARLRTKTRTDFLITQTVPILIPSLNLSPPLKPFTSHFPRADIHELLSSDLLHQVIKGTFKDHLVSWVNEYLHIEHGEKRALEIIQDIDRRISAVPEFPGLRRFPDGWDFSQWMGDDSKALMKIYLGAVGYLPSDMVKCLSAFMVICYLLRRNSISADDLVEIQTTLDRFHHYRDIFIWIGVRDNISLPRQHALVHYIQFIRFFGSPNGLCSSITESKHIKAMLTTISRLDKMAAAAVSFRARGMMVGTTYSYAAMVLDGDQPQVAAAAVINADEDEDEINVNHGLKSLSSVELGHTAARGYPKELDALVAHIQQPRFPTLFRRFLHEEIYGVVDDIALADCPVFCGRILVHHSVITRFYALSNLCASGFGQTRIGMAKPATIPSSSTSGLPSCEASSLTIFYSFFSFTCSDTDYQCALVRHPDTGMWVVKPELECREPSLGIVRVESMARAAHLIGLYGTAALPEDFHFSNALDAFNRYFVNLYADHHMYEFLK